MYMNACTCGSLWSPEKTLDSLELELQVVWMHGSWMLGPLGEQEALSTIEPSLQPRCLSFLFVFR